MKKGSKHTREAKRKMKLWKILNKDKLCHSPEVCKKISLAKMAEKNPMWKGDSVGYGKLHCWVKSRLKKPKYCQRCGKVAPYDLANIGNKYTRDLENWEWLCRRCHMIKDGRLKKFIKTYNTKKPLRIIKCKKCEKTKKYYAFNLCISCYQKQHYERSKLCVVNYAGEKGLMSE